MRRAIELEAIELLGNRKVGNSSDHSEMSDFSRISVSVDRKLQTTSCGSIPTAPHASIPRRGNSPQARSWADHAW